MLTHTGGQGVELGDCSKSGLNAPVADIRVRRIQVRTGWLLALVLLAAGLLINGAALAQSTHTLTVNVSGGGVANTNNITPSIFCPTVNCSAAYSHGTSVTLSAANFAGWTFQGWSGACSGTGSCTVTMTQARSVTAHFVQPAINYTLQVNVNGSGVVTSSSGINCSPIARALSF